MKDFLSHIIQRHSNSVNHVTPRLRTIFEQENTHIANMREDVAAKEESVPENRGLSQPFSVNGNDVSHTSNADSPTRLALNRELPDSKQNNMHSENIGKSTNEHLRKASKNEELTVPAKDLNPGFISEKNSPANHLVQPLSVEENRKKDTMPGTYQLSPASEIASTSTQKNLQKVSEENKPSSKVYINNSPLKENSSWGKNFKNIMQGYEAGENTKATPPVIKVNIGRIEVRASTQSTTVREKTDLKPAMSLDEFLKKKSGV